VQQWTAQLQAAPVDVLVNCAGEALVKPLEQTSDEELDRQLSINLKGQMLMTRALLPHLRQSANASIINIGSKTAIYGYANTTVYSAAKAGLLAFTRALAVELREAEIRVVTVNCGPVDTPMRWEATPNFDRKLVIAPEPVAELVWLLATLPRGTTTGDIVIQSVYNQ
jgi:NAD(P)-dependent dehydrogenase (short-subunit alcohol dehydrogenase family)